MSSQKIKVALIGNPNAGKTSLLNSLAGLRLHVGNWPGKTVTQKSATIKLKNKKIEIIDLPGVYSLTPFTEEEKISSHFITYNNPDVVIQIIDVNLLERSLFLFFELLALNKKVIIALNFNHEAQRRGLRIDIDKLKKILKIPIVTIEANTGENKEELLKTVLDVASKNYIQPHYINEIKTKNNLISHTQALNFIKKEISPFYASKTGNYKTERIDKWILNRWTAFPIFLLTMYAVFKITFVFSSPITKGFNNAIEYMEKSINLMASGWLASFLSQGVLNGLGSVLIFVPLVFSLFFVIALLEDSGYLSRMIVLLDSFFAKLGVTGRSFIPMILGFSCNVPAVLATRTIKNRKERLIAVFVNPFISCSARLVVYGLFASIFFPQQAMSVIMFLYILGVIIALVATLILTKLFPDKEKSNFLIEIPPYRWPTLKNVFNRAWWQTKMFVKKAGTIIFLLTVLVWFLASFPSGAEYGSVESWIGKIGTGIAPIFSPLGFGHWIFAVTILFGIVAKEAIVGAFGTLIHAGSAGLLGSYITQLISPLGALSFLVFVSLYMPCLATMSVVKSETNSWKIVFYQMLTTFSIAWLLAGVVYVGGRLLGF